MAIEIKEYIKKFPNSINLDFDRKEVTIVKKGRMKVYNKLFFDKMTKMVKEGDIYEYPRI